MPIQPADDFGVFAGSEHMFYGLRDPFAFIRDETERELRAQVPDTVLEALKTDGKPKFLTLGRKIDGGPKMLVTHFGFVVRARLHVRYEGGSRAEVIETALTFLWGDVDRRGSERLRTYFDVHADAERMFTDKVFEQRFLAFRAEVRHHPAG